MAGGGTSKGGNKMRKGGGQEKKTKEMEIQITFLNQIKCFKFYFFCPLHVNVQISN